MRSGQSFLTERPIAHRGFHDIHEGRPENTLAGARSAVDAGYGIECDVRLSSDGEVMVFHDAELERLTAQTGAFAEKSAEKLQSLSILGSSETVPTLRQLINLVEGSVPLIIE